MHSTPNPKEIDPRDFLIIAPEDKELSNLAYDAMRCSSAQTRMGSDFSAGSPIPPVDLRFRRAAVNNVEVPGDRPSIGRRAVRAFIRFLWVACLGGAGVAWRFYGDEAKQIIVKSVPPFALILSMPLENPKTPRATDLTCRPGVRDEGSTTATGTFGSRPARKASRRPPPYLPNSAQSLQSMARDLATTGQEIEQLKASIEQLKASQEQMFRDVAKASEQNRRPKVSASLPRSAAAPPRKPMPFRRSQAAVAPMLLQAAAPSVLRQPEPQPAGHGPAAGRTRAVIGAAAADARALASALCERDLPATAGDATACLSLTKVCFDRSGDASQCASSARASACPLRFSLLGAGPRRRSDEADRPEPSRRLRSPFLC